MPFLLLRDDITKGSADALCVIDDGADWGRVERRNGKRF